MSWSIYTVISFSWVWSAWHVLEYNKFAVLWCVLTLNHLNNMLSFNDNPIMHLLYEDMKWAPSSEFVSSSIPSWQVLTAHAQPFRGARDLAFCLKVPLDSLLVWASSEGSGETARMCIGDKYQIRLTRSKLFFNTPLFMPPTFSKLRGHIGSGLSVCLSIDTSIRASVTIDIWSRTVRDRLLKFKYNLVPYAFVWGKRWNNGFFKNYCSLWYPSW